MKKKKLSKKLDLGKKQISNLGNVKGGALAVSYHTYFCQPTQDLFTCTWHSELNTACDCPPSWGIVCPIKSINVCDA
jgi:hypothetical protein